MFTKRVMSRAARTDKYFWCSDDDLFSSTGGEPTACQHPLEKRMSLSLSVRDGIAMSANNSFRVGKQIEIQIDNDSDDM